MGNALKYAIRGRPAHRFRLSGGNLRVPRTSLDKLKLEVKRQRLKGQSELAREARNS